MSKKLKDVLEIINIYDTILLGINKHDEIITYINKHHIDEKFLNSEVDCIGVMTPRAGLYKDMPCLLIDIWAE